MQVSLWIWLATVAGVIALLALSFFTHIRRTHEPSIKEAGTWTALFASLSIVFGLGLTAVWGWDRGIEYFAGYITEYSLSIDNLFVFVVIMSSFAVPRAYQQKVLLIGIVIALILRTIFIVLGAAAIAYFSWVFYLFGVFLILTAARLALEKKHDEKEAYKPNVMVRAAQKLLPFSEQYDGARMSTIIDGKRHFTPMTMVMIAIGMSDILFALDSIPAIYGLTNAPYIVFTANAFALLGLIELYFLIGGLLKRLVFLSFGLALVLAFIGVKLIIEAMHANSLSFINGGEPIHWAAPIPTWLSVTIIVAILAITAIASLLKSRNGATESESS